MAGDRLAALAPPPRLVDWSIFALVALQVGSGLVSLVAGTPDWWWLFALHSVGGFTLVVMLFWKFRRVASRVTNPALWDGGTVTSVLLATLALAALATGIVWGVTGIVRLGPWTLLTGHMLLGVAVVPVLLWHLRHRFRLPRRRTLRGRREAIRLTALVAVGAATWRLRELGSRLLGADSRFTGSGDAGGEGNDFPVTSWVADDPDPVHVDDWALAVRGEVRQERTVDYDTLTPGENVRTTERAVLDCTSGWYAERDWEGVRVGDLLDLVGTTDEARWVRFRSVTGYRWSLPIDEARDALLATHVDGEPLTHGHGAPVRLVAPGRRGFQWVKWIDGVDVTPHEDLWQWIAIFVSGFD